jgi:O-antigen/teichoic acid export membrane protein
VIAKFQKDKEKVRSSYGQSLNMTASINAPLYMCLAAYSVEVQQILLGPKWTGVAHLVSIFALWASVSSIMNVGGALVFGTGRVRRAFVWGVFKASVFVPSLWLASQHGPVVLAWTMVALVVAFFVPGWYVIARPLSGVGIAEFSVVSLRPFLLAAISVGLGYFAISSVGFALARLVLGVMISAVLYLLLSYMSNRKWLQALLELVGLKMFAGHVLRG